MMISPSEISGDPHESVRNQFVSMLDTAISFAAESNLPIADTYTILHFLAARQMSILVRKAEDADAKDVVEADAKDVAEADMRVVEDIRSIEAEALDTVHMRLNRIQAIERKLDGVVSKEIHSSGLPEQSQHHSTNELARQFSSGSCPDCPYGGPTRCPNSCPAKDYCDNAAPDSNIQ